MNMKSQIRRAAGLLMLIGLSACGFEDKTVGAESPLCLLLREANVPRVKEALEQGANPNGYCNYEYGGNYYISKARISRPLLITALSGHSLEIARLLIHAGADVNAPYSLDYPGGYPPLSLSVQAGDLPTTKLLLEKGADPNGRESLVPLNIALRSRRLDFLNLLLQFGANPNATIPINKKLFHQLMETEYSFFKPAAEAMLGKGADINSKEDLSGRTPLHVTVEQSQFAGVVLKAQFLLNHGAKVNIQAKNGNSTLFEASRSNSKYIPELIKFLISRGADVNLKGAANMTILHQLVTNAHPEAPALIKQVIAIGANVNAQDTKGNTPLHYLARASYENEIAKATLLLKSGANLKIQNQASQTPLDLAQEQQDTELIKIFRKSR